MHAITKDSLDTRALLDWDATRFNNQDQATVEGVRSTSKPGPQLRFSVPRGGRPELDADSLLRVACTTGNQKAAAVALPRGAHVNGCSGKAPGRAVRSTYLSSSVGWPFGAREISDQRRRRTSAAA